MNTESVTTQYQAYTGYNDLSIYENGELISPALGDPDAAVFVWTTEGYKLRKGDEVELPWAENFTDGAGLLLAARA